MRFFFDRVNLAPTLLFEKKRLGLDGVGIPLIPPKGAPWYAWVGVPFKYKLGSKKKGDE